MTTETQVDPDRDLYPDSDGQPMSDNTLQFRWITTIQGNLEGLYGHDPNVFVAGDLLWYAVRGSPAIRAAPDAMVVFGRPKGDRGSYKQWEEGGIPPQVVFEVLSPGNRDEELDRKFEFYDRYGVEEYYVYDPDNLILSGWLRSGTSLQPIASMDGWVSPRLGIRFELSGDELVILRPDGERFLTFRELQEQREEERRQKEEERRQKEEAQRQAEEARRQAEEERRQKEEAQRQAEEARRQAEEARRQVEEERRQREETDRRTLEAQRQAEEADRRAQQAQRQAEEAQREAVEVGRRIERLTERLRALGIDLDA
jgi:Uma2 family endonuclease